MPWSEVSPGRFQRAIGENETFIKLVGDPGHALGREHWAINSIASFKPTGSLVKEDLQPLFLKAWKSLRFHHPSIAAQVIDNERMEYIVPDLEALHNWASKTFNVIYGKTADDIISTIKPNSFATLTYLPKSNEILCHTAHWRTDGIGVLQLLDAFVGLASTSNLLNPDTLPWGQESSRLAPSVEEAANIPEQSSDTDKALAQKLVKTFYQAASAVGIPYKGEGTTLPSGTHSFRLLLSTSETGAIIRHCKEKAITITSAVHASAAATNNALALPKNKDRHYTSTIRYSLRPYLPEPYCTPQYASGLYTTGWMKAVPASASWIENARAYNDEYRKGLTQDYINSHREYALGLVNLIRNMPQGGDPPSDVDISSVGIAENLIERVKGTSERGLEIQTISVGVETLTRQCVCFVWTFRDQLNLNLVYNESFHDDTDAARFLETLKSNLLEQIQ